ncbi:hypothetical protein L484_000647 [Morus notabilis]|uniref:Uncharacterized protein n=1 Tax=Morus notabilis TaxID=981085 RepID=W9SLX4_9ROSA|nr:hypothetical protein L484_000647 [Morus notabilis]
MWRLVIEVCFRNTNNITGQAEFDDPERFYQFVIKCFVERLDDIVGITNTGVSSIKLDMMQHHPADDSKTTEYMLLSTLFSRD